MIRFAVLAICCLLCSFFTQAADVDMPESSSGARSLQHAKKHHEGAMAPKEGMAPEGGQHQGHSQHHGGMGGMDPWDKDGHLPHDWGMAPRHAHGPKGAHPPKHGEMMGPKPGHHDHHHRKEESEFEEEVWLFEGGMMAPDVAPSEAPDGYEDVEIIFGRGLKHEKHHKGGHHNGPTGEWAAAAPGKWEMGRKGAMGPWGRHRGMKPDGVPGPHGVDHMHKPHHWMGPGDAMMAPKEAMAPKLAMGHKEDIAHKGDTPGKWGGNKG